MAQPSVACFFNTRKRSAIDNNKINQARKVLVLDSDEITSTKGALDLHHIDKCVVVPQSNDEDDFQSKLSRKLHIKEQNLINNNKIINHITTQPLKLQRKNVKVTKPKKIKDDSSQKHIEHLFLNMAKKQKVESQTGEANSDARVPNGEVVAKIKEDTTKVENVCEEKIVEENTLKEKECTKSEISLEKQFEGIKNKISRSAKLAELKASIARFKESSNKLKEIEKKTSQITSPKLKNFKSIELEVPLSPQKILSPEKQYLSPKKDLSAKRNLLNLLSPTKNAVALSTSSPSKKILETTSKPALTLPFKYRYLAEMFRAVDTVCQILYNRKETITFKKVKAAVEEMVKRNLTLKHIAQFNHIFPEAFTYSQEKLRVFGAGRRQEQWELVFKPLVDNNDHMTSDILLQRRRKLFDILIEKVKDYHFEFLQSLDPPLDIPKNKITRWHPEFDIERVPDIEQSELPQPPEEEKFTTGKEVLEKARQMFSCNTRMEQALERLKATREAKSSDIEVKPVEPTSVLKGIPKALLEKVRQKQAAKALVSMTRSADKDKEVLLYSRLPEIARLTKNVFVTEKKNVLLLDTVIAKLANCYRCHLTKTEMEEHLRTIAKEIQDWLVFHEVRHCVYVKLMKNSDLSLVLNKLEALAKQKSES